MTTPVPVSFFKKKLHNFIKKETLAQALSCEICQILKNVYFYRASLVAASEIHKWNSEKACQNQDISTKIVKVTINTFIG